MDLELLPPPGLVPPQSKLEHRLLTEDEVNQYVRPQFESRGHPLPNPAMFIGIIRNGEPTGSFITIQYRIHVDPMVINSGDEASLSRLAHAAEALVLERCGPMTPVYIFAPSGNPAELAKLFGMQAEPWTVFSKYVGMKEEVN